VSLVVLAFLLTLGAQRIQQSANVHHAGLPSEVFVSALWSSPLACYLRGSTVQARLALAAAYLVATVLLLRAIYTLDDDMAGIGLYFYPLYLAPLAFVARWIERAIVRRAR